MTNSKTRYGLNIREWRDLLILVHKQQSKNRYGKMDKIIKKTTIWSNMDRLEEGIKKVIFSLDK